VRDVLGYDNGYQIMIDANQVGFPVEIQQNLPG
jgi:hypothetical protein